MWTNMYLLSGCSSFSYLSAVPYLHPALRAERLGPWNRQTECGHSVCSHVKGRNIMGLLWYHSSTTAWGVTFAQFISTFGNPFPPPPLLQCKREEFGKEHLWEASHGSWHLADIRSMSIPYGLRFCSYQEGWTWTDAMQRQESSLVAFQDSVSW